eukprot:849469-Pyramimonas_sp.AAC.2
MCDKTDVQVCIDSSAQLASGASIQVEPPTVSVPEQASSTSFTYLPAVPDSGAGWVVYISVVVSDAYGASTTLFYPYGLLINPASGALLLEAVSAQGAAGLPIEIAAARRRSLLALAEEGAEGAEERALQREGARRALLQAPAAYSAEAVAALQLKQL